MMQGWYLLNLKFKSFNTQARKKYLLNLYLYGNAITENIWERSLRIIQVQIKGPL